MLKAHTGPSLTDMLIPVIPHRNVISVTLGQNVIFLAFMAILTPGPTLATKNVTGYMGAWSLS